MYVVSKCNVENILTGIQMVGVLIKRAASRGRLARKIVSQCLHPIRVDILISHRDFRTTYSPNIRKPPREAFHYQYAAVYQTRSKLNLLRMLTKYVVSMGSSMQEKLQAVINTRFKFF